MKVRLLTFGYHAGAMKSGKTDLTITNDGAVAHELLIFKSNRDPKDYPG